MIVVKVELHSAVTGEVSEIGRMHIINDGTGTLGKGNYRIHLFRRGTAKILREGEVKGHRRLTLPIWSLLAKALASVGFEKP